MIHDYENGVKFFKGKLRLGETYIFGKNAGEVYVYGDISHLFQHTQKRNGNEIDRQLRFKHKKGYTRDLCRIPKYGTAEAEVTRVELIVLLRNKGYAMDSKEVCAYTSRQ